MPVNIPVGFGLAQLRFIFSGSARESLCTFGYDPPSLDPQVHAQQITDHFTQAGRPGIPTQINESWTYLGVRVTEMDDVGPLTGEASDIQDGILSGGAMPPNCAILIRKTTGVGGRRNRGRMFVPPIYPPEGNVGQGGSIADPQVDNLNLWWGAFRTALVTAGLQPVIFHSEPPFTPTPDTSWIVQDLIATQRRRLRK